jgi:hypothetical protein
MGPAIVVRPHRAPTGRQSHHLARQSGSGRQVGERRPSGGSS